jgi:hypothetical protein
VIFKNLRKRSKASHPHRVSPPSVNLGTVEIAGVKSKIDSIALRDGEVKFRYVLGPEVEMRFEGTEIVRDDQDTVMSIRQRPFMGQKPKGSTWQVQTGVRLRYTDEGEM